MSQYNFETFFEFSMDMLCIASGDGYFKRVNASFQRTLGWTPEELTSRPFHLLCKARGGRQRSLVTVSTASRSITLKRFLETLRLLVATLLKQGGNESRRL